MADDSLGAPYLIRKYGPNGAPPETPAPTIQPTTIEERAPSDPGVPQATEVSGFGLTATAPAPPPAAPGPMEPVASGQPGQPLESQPPFALERAGMIPQAVPPGYRGTEPETEPTAPPSIVGADTSGAPTSTAGQVSQFLSSIGLQGLRPVSPIASLVESIYGQDAGKDANPVYRTAQRVATLVDGALTLLNLPFVGLEDAGNVILSPMTLGMRAAGMPESDVQGFVNATRQAVGLGAMGAGVGMPGSALGRTVNLDIASQAWSGAALAGETPTIQAEAQAITQEIASGKLNAPGLQSEAGSASGAVTMALARALGGAAAGGALGDTPEERVKNALIGAGVGAALSPALIRRVLRGVKAVEQEGATAQETTSAAMGDVAETARVKVIKATDPERTAYLERTGTVLPGEGDRLIQLNWAAVRDPAGIDALTREVLRARPPAQVTMTTEEMHDLGRELGLTSRQIEDVMQQGGALAARMLAWKDVTRAARQHLDALAQQVMALDENHPDFAAVDAAFRQQYGVTAALAQGLLRESSEIGRALNVLKSLPAEMDTAELAGMAGKDVSAVPTKTLAGQLTTLPEDAQIPFLRKVGQAVTLTLQTLNWAYINSLLSTMEGASANMATNLMMVAESPLLSFMAAGGGSVREAIQRAVGMISPEQEISRIYWGESFAQLYGTIQSIPEALSAAWDVAKGAESKFGGIAKEKPRFQPTGEALGIQPDEPAGVAIRLASTLMELPNRILLMSGDEFAKVLNYRASVYGQAYNMVEREFHGQWFAPLRSEEAAARFKQILDDPDAAVRQIATGKTESVGDLAAATANVRTFNDELTGRLQALSVALSAPLTRMTIAPFFRTPANIFKAGLERVPGFGLLVGRAWEDAVAGGARRDLMAAKQALGGALLGWGAWSGLIGDIQGGGARDPNLAQLQRDAGLQPYSIRVGDKMYGFNRFDVFGSLVGMAADYVQLRPFMRQDEADQIASAMILSISDNMLSKTFVSGAANVLKLVMARDPQNLEKTGFIRNLVAGGVVPSGVAQFERFQDPTIRSVYSMLDAIKARTPGWSATLPPKLNWLTGQPQLAPQGWHPDWLPGFVSIASPIKVTELTHDPVVKELLDNQVGIAAPPPFIYGTDPSSLKPPDPKQGVALSPEQAYWYTKLAAETQIDGQTQYEALADAFKSDWYQQLTPGPDGSRVDAIHKIVQGYRGQARVELLKKFPDLADALAHKIDNYGVLKGGEGARSSPADMDTLIKDLTR